MRIQSPDEMIVNGRLKQVGNGFRYESNRSAVFECECGQRKVIRIYYVRKGIVKSCGCLQKELTSTKFRTHGKYWSSEYQIWSKMKARCGNSNNKMYANYGGRGITVCDRWLNSFENFLADMGECPEGLSIDRFPDNDGNYEPRNCRWATAKEQQRNRRNNSILTIGFRTQCISAWSEESGIASKTISQRILKLGWSPEDAVFTPVGTVRRSLQHHEPLDF